MLARAIEAGEAFACEEESRTTGAERRRAWLSGGPERIDARAVALMGSLTVLAVLNEKEDRAS